MGQFLPAASCPRGASALAVTSLPLLLPVRLLVLPAQALSASTNHV